MKTLIALGGNLGNVQMAFEEAITRIGLRIGPILQRSSFMESLALTLDGVDPLSKPKYLNAAVLLESQLTPPHVLRELLEIERELGRDRGQETARWDSRIIDLDLIAYGVEVFESETLIVPHPRMHEREFVLKPMEEIWPEWRHPIFKQTISELRGRLG